MSEKKIKAVKVYWTEDGIETFHKIDCSNYSRVEIEYEPTCSHIVSFIGGSARIVGLRFSGVQKGSLNDV
jgi:hypothetical protein